MKLHIPNQNELRQIKKLYKKSFPPEEKKPFWLIRKGCRDHKLEMLSLSEDGFKGFVISMLFQEFVLIDYFAIQSGQRGNGCGSRALELLKERYHGKKIILEVEPPSEMADNNVQRIKRKQFYHRNGFHDTHIHVTVFGAPLELLAYNCDITFSEYCRIYQYCYGTFVARLLQLKQVK